MVQILSNYDYPAEVLVASVRNQTHLLRAAEIGADIATVPFAVLKQTLHHPLTDLGLERFPRRLAQNQPKDLICRSLARYFTGEVR